MYTFTRGFQQVLVVWQGLQHIPTAILLHMLKSTNKLWSSGGAADLGPPSLLFSHPQLSPLTYNCCPLLHIVMGQMQRTKDKTNHFPSWPHPGISLLNYVKMHAAVHQIMPWYHNSTGIMSALHCFHDLEVKDQSCFKVQMTKPSGVTRPTLGGHTGKHFQNQ